MCFAFSSVSRSLGLGWTIASCSLRATWLTALSLLAALGTTSSCSLLGCTVTWSSRSLCRWRIGRSGSNSSLHAWWASKARRSWLVTSSILVAWGWSRLDTWLKSGSWRISNSWLCSSCAWSCCLISGGSRSREPWRGSSRLLSWLVSRGCGLSSLYCWSLLNFSCS